MLPVTMSCKSQSPLPDDIGGFGQAVVKFFVCKVLFPAYILDFPEHSRVTPIQRLIQFLVECPRYTSI